ncbi:restriction endonuclease subunit S [Dickeya dadantii]|uniref:restriction endonuclease subunit S n=1 Tax=Dickeya dadantii TaxID=204038 RepID=UPI002543A286|nr:restriction endonuclease subunit S [Dickeya dadantii]
MTANSSWQVRTLGECATWFSGGTPSKSVSRYWSGNIPWISAKSLIDFYVVDSVDKVTDEGARNGTRLVPANTILFVVRGMSLKSEFRLGITTRPVTFNQDLKALVPNSDVDAVYLAYAIRAKTIEILQYVGEAGHGTGVLPTDRMQSLRIAIPPISEQKRIARVAQAIDYKIDLNRRINQTLEAIAQAIFKSWFVDFDPVKAKIAAIEQGQDPLRAAMRAISGKNDTELDQMPREHHDQLSATAALFPDEMEESELGEIPKGWAHGVLGDVCSFTAGSAFKPEHQGSTEGDYPFIKVSDMNLAGNEVFIQSANNYVSKAQQSEMKAKLHPLGATVFAKIGVALISNRRRLLTTPTIIDNNLMSASPAGGKSGTYFLYSMLSTIDFNTLVSGTALPYLNVSDLKKIPIVRPPHDVSSTFERKASSIFSMMQALAAQSVTLADTRDNLLPKLLSGEIDFSEALEG